VTRAFLITPLSPKTAGNEEPQACEADEEALGAASLENDVDLVRADDTFRAAVVIQQVRGEIEQAWQIGDLFW